MLKRVAVVALVACTPSSTEAPPPKPPAAAEAPPRLERFITEDVTGVLRSDAQRSPIVGYLSSLLEAPPPCWTKLTTAIRASYQLEVAGRGSYFLFEGDLPRPEVERCVTTALKDALGIRVTRAGELSAFESQAGTTYAAWRGSVVIAGTQAQVTAAMKTDDPALTKRWQQRIAELPTGVMAMWRDDALLANLFGVPTTSYAFALTRAEKAPRPYFAGQLVVRYATAEDAQRAAQRMGAGELATAVDAPPQLVAAFQRMKITTDAQTVTVELDSDMFEGLDLGQLQAWLAQLAVQPGTP